ncbi:MAG: hypothetical protein RL299_925, partial [Pseudomonadota bacterium]
MNKKVARQSGGLPGRAWKGQAEVLGLAQQRQHVLLALIGLRDHRG